jgi:hypothetical protein
MRHVTTLNWERVAEEKRRCSVSLDPVLAGKLSVFDSFFRPSTYIGMPCLGSARVVFDFPAVSARLSLRRPRSSPRSFRVIYSSSIVTPTRWPPRREFSIMAHPPGDFFEYTSGRWM